MVGSEEMVRNGAMVGFAGQLLDGLEETGAADSTIVCFHADHGWALGENNMFRKFHNTELSTRVPLIIAVPWLPAGHGQHARSLFELVDVFPTIVDLAELPLPSNEVVPLSGVSQTAVLHNASAVVKSFALSQYVDS